MDWISDPSGNIAIFVYGQISILGFGEILRLNIRQASSILNTVDRITYWISELNMMDRISSSARNKVIFVYSQISISASYEILGLDIRQVYLSHNIIQHTNDSVTNWIFELGLVMDWISTRLDIKYSDVKDISWI